MCCIALVRCVLAWLQPRVCTLIWLHTEPHLHTTMRPPPTTPRTTTHSPLTEWHIWITPLIVTAQYQHVAITLRSRQLLKMGTWLPKTCWANCKREIKNTKVTSSWFLIHTVSLIWQHWETWATATWVHYILVAADETCYLHCYTVWLVLRHVLSMHILFTCTVTLFHLCGDTS